MSGTRIVLFRRPNYFDPNKSNDPVVVEKIGLRVTWIHSEQVTHVDGIIVVGQDKNDESQGSSHQVDQGGHGSHTGRSITVPAVGVGAPMQAA